MTKIRCVGGPCDNREVERTGDRSYFLHVYGDLPDLASFDPNEPIQNATATYETHVYTLRFLGSGRELLVDYLAPESCSDQMAIKHQFAKGAEDADKLRARTKCLEDGIREVIGITERNPMTAVWANLLKAVLLDR